MSAFELSHNDTFTEDYDLFCDLDEDIQEALVEFSMEDK